MVASTRRLLALASTVPLTACRIELPGERLERQALEEEGKAYAKPFEERELPEIRPDSPYGDLVSRALRADPEIERAYFEWAAAFQRAVVAGTPPDPVFGLGWMFDDPLGTFTRNFMALAVLPLPAPEKRETAALVAFEEAAAARQRYAALETVRRGRFRQVYAGFDFASRSLDLVRREVELLTELREVALRRVAAGSASASEVLRVEGSLAEAENRELAARAALRGQAGRVNAALSRDPTEPLDPAPPLEPFELDSSARTLVELAVRNNPDLRFLEGMERAAKRGIDDAESQDNPDFALQYERQFTDQYMLQFTLPLQRDRVEAAMAEARARFAAQRAELRRTRNQVASETLDAALNFEEATRRRAWIDARVLPPARAAYELSLAKLLGGNASLSDVLEAKRVLLAIELEAERARTDREAAVGDLLACCGIDVGVGPAALAMGGKR